MIKIAFLLAEDQPPFRLLVEAEFHHVPEMHESVALGGRSYRVVERSYRIGTKPVAAALPGLPEVQPEWTMDVGILLQQIGGPPHIAIVRDTSHLQ